MGLLAVLNVITGVFCQSAMESAQRDPELLANSLLRNRNAQEAQMTALFERIDTDDSGEITISELEALLSDSMVQAHFQALNLKPGDAWTLFKLLDTDQSNKIDLEEFVLGCLQLQGSAS